MINRWEELIIKRSNMQLPFRQQSRFHAMEQAFQKSRSRPLICCIGPSKQQVSRLSQSFSQLQPLDQLDHYALQVQAAQRAFSDQSLQDKVDVLSQQGWLEKSRWIGWQPVRMLIEEGSLKLSLKQKVRSYPLQNFIVRKSNKKDREALALDFFELQKVFRLAFRTSQVRQLWLQTLKFIYSTSRALSVRSQRLFVSTRRIMHERQHQDQVFEDILKGNLQGPFSQTNIPSQSFRKAFLSRMLPSLSKQLKDKFFSDQGYKPLHANDRYSLLIHKQQSRLRMVVPSKQSCLNTMKALNAQRCWSSYNNQLVDWQLIRRLPQVNSIIYRMTFKPLSTTYKSRRLLVIRHICALDNRLIIAERSLPQQQTSSFIAARLTHFVSFVRIQANQPHLILDLNLSMEGCLPRSQQVQLCRQFLQGMKLDTLQQRCHHNFEWEWPSRVEQVQQEGVREFKQESVSDFRSYFASFNQYFSIIEEESFSLQRQAPSLDSPIHKLRIQPSQRFSSLSIFPEGWRRDQLRGGLVFESSVPRMAKSNFIKEKMCFQREKAKQNIMIKLARALSLAPAFFYATVLSAERLKSAAAFSLALRIAFQQQIQCLVPQNASTLQMETTDSQIYGQQIGSETGMLLISKRVRVSCLVEYSKHGKKEHEKTSLRGRFKVFFEDGQQITIQGMKGQFRQLSFSRLFVFRGITVVRSSLSNSFLFLKFNSQNSIGYQLLDYFQGQLLRVRSQFLEQNDFRLPRAQEVQQYLQKLNGNWPLQINASDKLFFNISQFKLPHLSVSQYLLHSDIANIQSS